MVLAIQTHPHLKCPVGSQGWWFSNQVPLDPYESTWQSGGLDSSQGLKSAMKPFLAKDVNRDIEQRESRKNNLSSGFFSCELNQIPDAIRDLP